MLILYGYWNRGISLETAQRQLPPAPRPWPGFWRGAPKNVLPEGKLNGRR